MKRCRDELFVAGIVVPSLRLECRYRKWLLISLFYGVLRVCYFCDVSRMLLIRWAGCKFPK